MEKWWPVVGAVLILVISSVVIWKYKSSTVADSTSATVEVTPAPAEEQLKPDQQPKVTLRFEPDGHFVVVYLSNLHADAVEYNLIYDATVRGNKIQTGVNATKNIKGQTEISQRQLLGSESSGKFTYHENIRNAYMELVLRDAAGQSVFTSTYPFTVQAGKTTDLKPQE